MIDVSNEGLLKRISELEGECKRLREANAEAGKTMEKSRILLEDKAALLRKKDAALKWIYENTCDYMTEKTAREAQALSGKVGG